MSRGRKPTYAALPVRAIGDHRLEGTHLRTLAAIAAHDRFSKNGTGCWASTKSLAALVGCHPQTAKGAVRDLICWGYVDHEPQPGHKQKRILRVIYNGHDCEAFNSSHGHNRKPTGYQSEPEPVVQKAETGSLLPSQATEIANANLPLREEEIARSFCRRDPAEAAARCERAALTVDSSTWDADWIGDRQACGEWLRKLEALLKIGVPDTMAPGQRARWVVQVQDILDTLMEVHDGHGDSIGGWAYRLADEVFMYSDRQPIISGPVRAFEEQHAYVDSSQVRDVITEAHARGERPWRKPAIVEPPSHPLEAPHTGQPANKLGPIQTEYGGRPTLIVRALDLLRDGGGGFPWTRGDVAAELDVRPGDAGRVLKDLCQRGYAERIGHGRYMLTEAARKAA